MAGYVVGKQDKVVVAGYDMSWVVVVKFWRDADVGWQR